MANNVLTNKVIKVPSFSDYKTLDSFLTVLGYTRKNKFNNLSFSTFITYDCVVFIYETCFDYQFVENANIFLNRMCSLKLREISYNTVIKYIKDELIPQNFCTNIQDISNLNRVLIHMDNSIALNYFIKFQQILFELGYEWRDLEAYTYNMDCISNFSYYIVFNGNKMHFLSNDLSAICNTDNTYVVISFSELIKCNFQPQKYDNTVTQHKNYKIKYRLEQWGRNIVFQILYMDERFRDKSEGFFAKNKIKIASEVVPSLEYGKNISIGKINLQGIDRERDDDVVVLKFNNENVVKATINDIHEALEDWSNNCEYFEENTCKSECEPSNNQNIFIK